MGYTIIKNGKENGTYNDPDWMEFSIPNVESLSTLPTLTTKPKCAISSEAHIETTGVTYELLSTNVWDIKTNTQSEVNATKTLIANTFDGDNLLGKVDINSTLITSTKVAEIQTLFAKKYCCWY